MRTSKKKTGKTKAPAAILEYAGDHVCGNSWLKIGLTRKQLALVTRLGKQWGFKTAPAATCARWLVMLGLVNMPVLEATWRKVSRYAEAEGLIMADALEARVRETARRMSL